MDEKLMAHKDDTKIVGYYQIRKRHRFKGKRGNCINKNKNVMNYFVVEYRNNNKGRIFKEGKKGYILLGNENGDFSSSLHSHSIMVFLLLILLNLIVSTTTIKATQQTTGK